MTILMLNLVLAFIWAAITGTFTLANLMIGFLLGYVTLYFVRGTLGTSVYFEKARQMIGLFFFFLWELLVANIRVARAVLSPRPVIHPRVVAVPLETCDPLRITILANVVSLTPGTLSLDVSTDRCVLYIHAMWAEDPEALRREIKEGFERRILAILGRGPELKEKEVG